VLISVQERPTLLWKGLYKTIPKGKRFHNGYKSFCYLERNKIYMQIFNLLKCWKNSLFYSFTNQRLEDSGTYHIRLFIGYPSIASRMISAVTNLCSLVGPMHCYDRASEDMTRTSGHLGIALNPENILLPMLSTIWV